MARQIISVTNWKVDTFETDNRTFYVGHRYMFVNDELAVSQLIRVTEKTVDITSPNNITLTVESTQNTLVDYQIQARKTKEKLAETKADLARNKRRTKALVAEVKKLQEENAQLRRDALVRQGSGQTVAGGPTEPVNGDWGPVIKHAARLMNVQIDDSGVNLVKAQIRLESSGNEKALGGDDGLSDGRASGLLQFKPGTFNHYALNGHKDIWKGFDQLLAFFNIPNALSQITGTHGWSPSGSPRYTDVPNKEVSGGAKKLQDTARKYLGVPYVWGGAGGARGGNPYSGMDCSSFVSQVYKDLGISIPAYTVDMERYGHQISRSEVQAGDMGFYGNHGASYHITLALDNKRMIYEPAPGQSCMEQDINAYPPTWWIRNNDMARIVAGG
jgi:cell wall-associated NlpC family hydrolase